MNSESESESESAPKAHNCCILVIMPDMQLL